MAVQCDVHFFHNTRSVWLSCRHEQQRQSDVLILAIVSSFEIARTSRSFANGRQIRRHQLHSVHAAILGANGHSLHLVELPVPIA